MSELIEYIPKKEIFLPECVLKKRVSQKLKIGNTLSFKNKKENRLIKSTGM